MVPLGPVQQTVAKEPVQVVMHTRPLELGIVLPVVLHHHDPCPKHYIIRINVVPALHASQHFAVLHKLVRIACMVRYKGPSADGSGVELELEYAGFQLVRRENVMQRPVDKDEVKERGGRTERVMGDVEDGDGVDEFWRQLVEHRVLATFTNLISLRPLTRSQIQRGDLAPSVHSFGSRDVTIVKSPFQFFSARRHFIPILPVSADDIMIHQFIYALAS